MEYPLKLYGTTWWDEGEDNQTKFESFIVRSAQELYFEFQFQRSRYWGTLNRDRDGYFAGLFSIRGVGPAQMGQISCCKLREAEDDLSYSLFGKWIEGRRSYTWYAELDREE